MQPRHATSALDDEWTPPPAPRPPPPPVRNARITPTAPSLDRWSSADRAVLEAQSRGSIVAVEKRGDALDVLPTCAIPGSYAYTPVTPKEERLTLKDEDDLRIVVPLDALALRPQLRRLGSIDVMTTTVGYYRASRPRVTKGDLPAGCEHATHVVVAMTVGAYSYLAETRGTTWEILRSDGNPAACALGEKDESRAPRDCGALLRLELAAVDQGGNDDEAR